MIAELKSRRSFDAGMSSSSAWPKLSTIFEGENLSLEAIRRVAPLVHRHDATDWTRAGT